MSSKPKVISNQVGSDYQAQVSIEDEKGIKEHNDIPVEYNKPMGKQFATVGFQAGITRNMGNYNSARVDVILHLPCETTELEEAYEFARNWVNAKLEEVVESQLKHS